MTEYTAANIRVATDAEIISQWDWALVGHWAHQYSCHPEWLQRAVEACRRAGREPGYIERRYLQRRDDEPLDAAVDTALRELRDEEQAAQFRGFQREAARERQ